MIIYKAANNINGKIYIGQTIRSLEVRISEHTRANKSLLGKAIRKYGKESFKFEIIAETNDFDLLQKMEEYYIEKLGTISPNGYNLVKGGMGTMGYHHSSESRELMSQCKRGKFKGSDNHFYGKSHSEESLRKMRKPKNFSNESLQRIREAHPTVAVKNITTGEEFHSVKEAAKEYQVAASNITRACRHPQRSCKGCKWSYL